MVEGWGKNLYIYRDLDRNKNWKITHACIWRWKLHHRDWILWLRDQLNHIFIYVSMTCPKGSRDGRLAAGGDGSKVDISKQKSFEVIYIFFLPSLFAMPNAWKWQCAHPAGDPERTWRLGAHCGHAYSLTMLHASEGIVCGRCNKAHKNDVSIVFVPSPGAVWKNRKNYYREIDSWELDGIFGF